MELQLPRQPKTSTRVRQRQRQRQIPGGDDPSNQNGTSARMVILKSPQLNRVVRRHFTLTGTINSTVGGLIAVGNASVGSTISGLSTLWTNYAQEYQEYRVLWFEIYLSPSTTSATSTTGPYQGQMFICPWRQLVPNSSQTAYQSPELVVFSTLEERAIKVSAKGFPNAQLWNQYGVSYPADRDFGIIFFSAGSTLAVSSNIFSYAIRILAEFKVPQ